MIELHVNMLLDLKQISEEQFFAFNECSSHSCLVHHVSALEDKTLSEVRDNIASLRNSEGIHALMNIYWKIVTMFKQNIVGTIPSIYSKLHKDIVYRFICKKIHAPLIDALK